MKVKQLKKDTYQISDGGRFAVVRMKLRNGSNNWFYRAKGAGLVATGTPDLEAALQIAGGRLLNGSGPTTSTSTSRKKSSVTLGELLDRVDSAVANGRLEGRGGTPLATSYAKGIRFAIKRILGSKYEHTKLSEFAAKEFGVSKPVAKYSARHFADDNGKPIKLGRDFLSRTGTYNNTIRHLKALVQKRWVRDLFSDLSLDSDALESIRDLDNKKSSGSGFRALPKELVAALDKHFSFLLNIAGTPETQHCVYLRYWLARCCGLRRSEIANARQNWISRDGDRAWLTVSHTSAYEDHQCSLESWSPKSREERTVPIPGWLADYCAESRLSANPDEPLQHYLGHDQERSSHEKSWKKNWRRAISEAGFDWADYGKTTHQLRGEFCTAVGRELGLQAAAAYAGHASPETTRRHYFDQSTIEKDFVLDPVGPSLCKGVLQNV